MTGISNEVQHTSLFHMLKCPTFLMVLPALEMSPMQPSFLHPALCTPFQKNLSTATNTALFTCFYCILLSFIFMQTWDENNAHTYSVPKYMSHQELLVFSMCWHLGNILEASGKLSLRFRHSFYIEDVPLLEQLNNCSIKCFFSCCHITVKAKKENLDKCKKMN